jgi:ribosomal protein S18 acetylase RimI-like enzyme
MEVRRATTEDVSAIERVAEVAWQRDYPDVLSREIAVDGVHEWYDEGAISSELDHTDAAVLVAETDGGVVGFAHAAWTGSEGSVIRVYVDPEHRGRAVGSALLETAVATLFEQGVDVVRAMVLADNEPGQAFYRSHGFRRVEGSRETVIAGETFAEYTFVLER